MGGWWQSTIESTPGHGASAFQDMTALRRFLTLHEDRPGFDVTGMLIVTTDFTHLKTNVFRKSDFILEEIAFGREAEPSAARRISSQIDEDHRR